MSTENALMDLKSSTCIDSTAISPTTPNPIYSVTVNNVDTNLLTVQLYYGQTNETAICDKLVNVLHAPYPNTGQCKTLKPCTKTWECSENRICEYQCSCSGNGACKLDVITHFVLEFDWKICEIRV